MKMIPSQLRVTTLLCASALATSGYATSITLNPGQPFVMYNGSIAVNQVFNQGQQVLNFSNYGGDPENLMGALLYFDTSGFQFAGNGVLPTYQFSNAFGGEILTALSFARPMSSVSLDDATGQIQKLGTSGSLTIISKSISGWATGGTLALSNLKVDFVNHTVTGDVAGARNSTGAGTALKTYAPVSGTDVVLWTFDVASGTQALPLACWQVVNFNSCLSQQGWGLNSAGRLVASHTLSKLALSTQATSLIQASLGLSATGVNAMKGINPYLDPNTGNSANVEGWGNIALNSEWGVPGNAVSLPADGLVIRAGQSGATAYTLPNGVALRIKHENTSSGLTVATPSFDTSAPATTEQGWAAWLNALNVGPSSAAGQVQSVGIDTLNDPRFVGGPEFSTNVVTTGLRFTGKSNTAIVTVDGISGALKSLGGFGMGMYAPYMNGFMGGGLWRAANITYVMSSQNAVGDLSGNTFVVGDASYVPGVTITPQTGIPLWSYANLTGPTTIPLSSLSTATSVAALPAVLQSAGFTVTSVTSTAINFKGFYKFIGLSVKTGLKDFSCFAMACTPLARDALMSATSDYLGFFGATVNYSLPLTP